jgi:signal transduction histidine kinase
MAEHSIDSEHLILLLRKLAHDLRGTLGSVISTSDMLAQGVYDPLTPKQARASERLQRTSRRSLAILEDFMIYIKAETGQLEVSEKPFNPRMLLDSLCKQIKPYVEEKGVALHLTIEDKIPTVIYGDESVMSRALVALLWNAAGFTNEGEIHIEAHLETEETWLIRVKDTGSGIPEEEIPHLFEPFWRGQQRPQTPTAGAGLGLPVSRSLISLIGGKVFLNSTGNRGSVFCIEAPLKLAATDLV